MPSFSAQLLQSASPWRERVDCFETIDSTNSHALQLGEAGAAEGRIVITEEQSSGRGQFQRPWFSPAGRGVWMSLLLRPLIKPETIPSLSRFAVVALYDAILTLGIDIKNMNIKAPNDLLVDGKKVAGVLVETRLGGSSFAVVGIGLNVLQQQSEFPTELRDRVTSLASVTGTEEIDRQTIVIALLQSLHERYQQLLHQPAELDLLWQSRLV